MAADLLGFVSKNLVPLVQNEFATISGIKQKAKQLENQLNLIKEVLKDAEEKQMTNDPLKAWLQRLKDAMYVLDDILDECSIESHRLGGLSSFHPKNIMFCHGIGSRLKEITSRFDQIDEDMKKFPLSKSVEERPSEVAEWRETGSTIDQLQVRGRDGDKEKIVEFLLSQARGSDVLSIYPIVGLGGVGKTTLAQLVYNDEWVSSHFDLKIWVCVSENFSIKKILCSILASVAEQKSDVSNLDVLERKVQKQLKSKSYLLVLDDVWNRSQALEFGLSPEKWIKLKSVLSCGSKGASILVSTRDMDVATIMGTCQAHRLSGLLEDDCWLLFKQYAFGPDQEVRPELEEIGRKIVKKCGGLPLAAQALGGLLRTKNEEKEWLEVMESSFWTSSDQNSILPALRLSYLYLTPTLKQCFAFCAIFPKDTRIRKENLIHLWMANGFISSRANLEVEDVGSNILNELCQKSFFQDIEKDDYSGDISFKMHDLVHDLAQSVMEQECMFFESVNMHDLSPNTHHVGFIPDDRLSFNKGFFKNVESLRTLYQLETYNRGISICFEKYCSLRALHVACYELPSFKNLLHLRYLELYGSSFKIQTLPDSICGLRKLEVLKLIHFHGLQCLPEHLSYLQSLRHLIIRRCPILSHMFPNIGKLPLRTLSRYIVSVEQGHSLTELHNLKLGGKLRILGLGNVGSIQEAEEANLSSKKDLRGLLLSGGNDGDIDPSATHAEQIFEALQPHSSLKKLAICNYKGSYLPSWVKILNNLVVLKFVNCNNCVQLPSFSKLACLRKLKISSMNGVKYIDEDECYDGVAFPALKELILKGLPNLKRLLKVERGDIFPCLSEFEIDGCPRLVLPCLPSVERLTVNECTDELLTSISGFCGLTFLSLDGHMDLTSFPDGMWRNLTCLKFLQIWNFPKLKELPYELLHLDSLQDLNIGVCPELECLPEQILEGLSSLQTLFIGFCKGLRSLPEALRHLSSLEVLEIEACPALMERCQKETGEDWDKIAHIPKLILDRIGSDTD